MVLIGSQWPIHSLVFCEEHCADAGQAKYTQDSSWVYQTLQGKKAEH